MADDQKDFAEMKGQAAQAPAPTGGFWRSLADIFVDPVKVFARIDAGLSWWKPYIFISIVTMAIGYLMLPFNQKAMQFTMQARSPEQAEQMKKYGPLGLIMIPIGIILVTLIVAGIAHVIINIMSSRSSFKKTLGLILYCGVISLVGQIITAVVVMGRGLDSIESMADMKVSLSLAALFPEMKGALAALLQSLGIFEIWGYVLLVLGVAAIFKISRKQAIVPVIPIWLVSFLMLLLGDKFQGGAR